MKTNEEIRKARNVEKLHIDLLIPIKSRKIQGGAKKISHNIRTVAVLALAMSDFPNKQGAFIGEGVSTARDIESTFDGEAFPFSARRGTALTLTANTTQIGFQ